MASGSTYLVSDKARTAIQLASAGTTGQFYRGDRTWSDTLLGTLKITNNSNTLTIGSQNASWTHIYSSANIAFIFNNRVCTTAGGLGNSVYPWSDLWLNGAINYKGTAANYSVISFKDSQDAYGLGVIIGAGGLTCIGGGESASTVAASISSGGSEQLCLSNDGVIDFYTNCQNGMSNAVHTTIDTAGNFSGGVNSSKMTDMAFTWPGSYTTGSYMLIWNNETGTNGGQLFKCINRANTAAWVDNEHKWARIGGDTFTGNVHAYKAGDTYFRAGNSDTGIYCYLDSDAKGTGGNHGIYSNGYWNGSAFVSNGKWLIVRTQGGGVTVNGNSDTANYQNCVAGNEIRYARNGNMSSAASLWQGWAFAEGKVAVINDWRFGNGNGGLAPIYGSKVYNAVWNDFAEYRESDEIEGGRVLVSNGSGKLVRSTERLLPAARVISDTFGCSVGQSDTARTPIGVAGRVLVFPYLDRENYKVGDAVCAAPNGTADIMTREEIIQYPDRIIGIVDEIPQYEIWDQVFTNKKDDGEIGEQNHTSTPVYGRIWIYVR